MMGCFYNPFIDAVNVVLKYFPGANLDTIRATLNATTQLGTRGAGKGFTQ
jgi:hypothetical protein